MILDTEIKDWEQLGDVTFAIAPPEPAAQTGGSIYVRGSIECLKEFFFTFVHTHIRFDEAACERHYSKYFNRLMITEDKGIMDSSGVSEINVRCERFYLDGRFGMIIDNSGDFQQVQIRPFPLLDYRNRYARNNFNDMLLLFNDALELYRGNFA